MRADCGVQRQIKEANYSYMALFVVGTVISTDIFICSHHRDVFLFVPACLPVGRTVMWLFAGSQVHTAVGGWSGVNGLACTLRGWLISFRLLLRLRRDNTGTRNAQRNGYHNTDIKHR